MGDHTRISRRKDDRMARGRGCPAGVRRGFSRAATIPSPWPLWRRDSIVSMPPPLPLMRHDFLVSNPASWKLAATKKRSLGPCGDEIPSCRSSARWKTCCHKSPARVHHTALCATIGGGSSSPRLPRHALRPHASSSDRRPRCPRAQPAKRHGRPAPRPARLPHRRERLRQVEPCIRHPLRRGAAALRRKPLHLCPAIPRPAAPSRRR